jgi:hypothetical protein
MKKVFSLILVLSVFFANRVNAQFDEDQMGAWYMYFFSTQFGESNFGVQGDVQFRNWDLGSDLEQLLLRGGFTYKPSNTDIKFTLGYGNITTGAFGDDDSTVSESRIYQEALFPTNFADKVLLTHRFRYEQRFVDNQDMRTRYRYNLFVNVPLNKKGMGKGAIYLALYNELFINGQREIGSGNMVEVFDRNRFYIAFGYTLKDGLRTQLGIMKQTTNTWSKNQLQLSLHHSF